MKQLVTLGLLAVVGTQRVRAEEPAYCHPETFYATEQDLNEFTIAREHRFKVGKLNLLGMSVGLSFPSAVSGLAKKIGGANKNQGYCTWYYNRSNPFAQGMFNWHFVERPGSAGGTAADYREAFGASVDEGAASMVSCAEQNNYVAMGCDGMQHRGPTVFAMFLAFTGCTPEHSVQIANHIWGLNGVPPEARLEMAQVAAQLGEERPVSRRKLQDLMLAR